MIAYFHAFYMGLVNILPLTAQGRDAFLFMLVGIFIGFWVGILPGIGGATALALMLPFIFKMDPTTAFAFLLGSNAVAATTGDITSILFGVPGEGTTAAMIVDGHPMAKKGEAGRALGAALTSALVGALFGALVLALAIPIVEPLVLSIGAPEFFMLALLGITFVATLSGGNVVKGLISGAFGLMLSMVGLDPINSVPRFTFQSLLGQNLSMFFWDGISLVTATVGLFAIPEIIDLAISGTSIAQQQVGKLGGVFEGVKDTFRHWWLVMRCSVIGAYIGILPGIGGGTAQWVAYAHAAQSSRDKNRFGKGAIEGVLGPGAASNSKEGGALVPTVAFGIPGSLSMAILLGAFIIQGLVPGPGMLDPARHLTLTFSFVWIIVVSNIITVAVCFFFLEQLAKMTNVRGSLLIPFLLFLVYLGGFSAKNSFGDMILVLLFGVLGWLMVQFDWQRPPMLLGLVLGRIAERNLFISTERYETSWLTRPGVLVIGLIALGSILYPIWQNRKKRDVTPAAEARSVGSTETASVIVNPAYRVLFALAVLLVFTYGVWKILVDIRPMSARSALFPLAICLPGLVLTVLAFGQELLRFSRQQKFMSSSSADESAVDTNVVRGRTLMILFWTLGFFLAIWLFGFVAAVPLASFLYLKVGAREKWWISVTLAVLAWIFFYGLFDYTLSLPFPPGEVLAWIHV